jgi:hypothetical protein
LKRKISASVPRSKVKKPKVMEEGRVCSEPKCTTILSKYNTDPLCFLHAPPKQRRIRGRKMSESDDLVDTTVRCYACAIRLGGWGQPAEEVEFDGTFHWVVSISGSATRLCDIR